MLINYTARDLPHWVYTVHQQGALHTETQTTHIHAHANTHDTLHICSGEKD